MREMRKRRAAVLILLLIANATALVLVWEQPSCAASMACHQTETIPEALSDSLPYLYSYNDAIRFVAGEQLAQTDRRLTGTNDYRSGHLQLLDGSTHFRAE